MEIFSKELTDTDVRARFSFPTHCLEHLDFAGNNSVDLRVKDSCGELRVIRCLKRNGDYEKPAVLLREDDHSMGSQFRIEARRRIVLFGREAWGEVTRATNY
ncbi:hypothetical protein DKX38_003809 [Salix brachista]|uniref:Uncharacterized protein n=1 Tax=Salix brachista TaxID=2182728 RepID=A0A5N5N8Q4_9ROSI|nr:hypothetical protein DKX38_003809 [Salix brachista]